MGLPNTELSLPEQFLQYGRYVRDWSPQTVTCYRAALTECPSTPTKANLNALVMAMRERGLSAGGINVRARAINSYLTWLHEDGHLPERLKIKLLKNPPKPIKTLTDHDIKRLASFRPKGRIQTRTWMLAMLLLDCGLRISEDLNVLPRNFIVESATEGFD